jgi:hypothetical protein
MLDGPLPLPLPLPSLLARLAPAHRGGDVPRNPAQRGGDQFREFARHGRDRRGALVVPVILLMTVVSIGGSAAVCPRPSRAPVAARESPNPRAMERAMRRAASWHWAALPSGRAVELM